MHVPLSIWLITSVVILGFFIFDFVSHVRTPHEPTMKESGGWALFYMSMACVFGGIVWWLWDAEHAVQFFTGYITELSLSVDNLFVFALIMGSFKIPRAYQQKVLLIGIVIGAVPGVGSSLGNLIAYAETKRTSKDPSSFGKGNPKGVIAAESAVASSEGGSMATMLALGIPGGGATAILLAAFMMHNIVPGPQFIETQKDMVYAIILNNIVQAIVLLVVGIGFIYAVSNIVRVRTRFILPAILVIATMGTYAVEGSISGPITLFVFSLIGFLLVKFDYPVAAVVVGLLLGSMLETEFLRSYQLSGGDPTYLFQRPGAMALFAIMFFSMAMTAWGKRKQVRAEEAESAAMEALARQADMPDTGAGAAGRS